MVSIIPRNCVAKYVLTFQDSDFDIRVSWLQINGMSDSESVARIKEHLPNVPGFNNIEVYIEDGKAFLEYDLHQTTCDHIVDRINQLGFECFVLEDNHDNSALGLSKSRLFATFPHLIL